MHIELFRRVDVRELDAKLDTDQLIARSPLLAQSGRANRADEGPLLGVKRTRRGRAVMSANDPKRTLAQPAPGAFSKVESRDIIGQGAWAVGEVSSNRRDRPARVQRLRSHFNLSRILSSPARAQASSNLAPGAPLAPIAPIVSSHRSPCDCLMVR